MKRTIAGVAALVLLTGCTTGGTAQRDIAIDRALYAQSQKVEVVYEIDGKWGFDVTMATPNGTTQKGGLAGVQTFKYQFDPGEFLYISAQTVERGEAHSCKITVDGLVIARNEASGAYSIVTCEGKS